MNLNRLHNELYCTLPHFFTGHIMFIHVSSIVFWEKFSEIINLKINFNNPTGNEFAKVKIWTSRWHSVFMNLPFASSAHICDKLSAGIRNIVHIQHNFEQNTISDTLIYLINVGRAKNRNYPVCWVADSSWRPKFVVSRNYGVLVVYIVVVPGPGVPEYSASVACKHVSILWITATSRNVPRLQLAA